jgi:hypothetical protein
MIAPPSTCTPSVHSWSGLAPKSCLDRAGPEGHGVSGTRRRPSVRSCHLPDSFRPCRSSRLRRFSPLGTSRVCCNPQPTMGFATFRGHGPRAAVGSEDPAACRSASASREGRGPGCLPPTVRASGEARPAVSASASARGTGSVPGGATPFGAFPSPAAVPRHRDRCPLAFRAVSRLAACHAPGGADRVACRGAVLGLRALLH